MVIYSKSFPIKDYKALQLIKLIKRIKPVKNSFIKTFTFLLSRDSHDFELQSTQVAMRGLKGGLRTLTMWKTKSPPKPPSIHLNKGASQPINFITLSGIFYFPEREALLLTVGGFPDMSVQRWALQLPPYETSPSQNAARGPGRAAALAQSMVYPMTHVQVKRWPQLSGLKAPIEETLL